MLVTINTQNFKLAWDAKGIDRIAQNVFNLITTFKYEVAYDRTLGLDGSFIDKPLEIAIAQATAQIYDIVAEREPRATVKSVDFKSIDDLGNLQFEVVVDI
jgi:phage baseplate assembly protein W